MRRMLLPVLGLALVLPYPSAGAARATLEIPYERVIDALVGTFGFVPETAVVNGVEVPSEEALKLLQATSVPSPTAAAPRLPTDDIGLGIREGPDPCIVAAVVTSYAASTGWWEEALINEEAVGTKGNPVPVGPYGWVSCGSGFTWITGEISADISPASDYHNVCANVWLVQAYSCGWRPFSGVTVAGHVGKVDIFFTGLGRYFHIEQVAGGVLWNGVERDAAAIWLQG